MLYIYTNSTHPQSKYTIDPTFKADSPFLTARGRSKEYPSIPRATQENLELNPPPHLLDSIKNKKTRSWTDTEL